MTDLVSREAAELGMAAFKGCGCYVWEKCDCLEKYLEDLNTLVECPTCKRMVSVLDMPMGDSKCFFCIESESLPDDDEPAWGQDTTKNSEEIHAEWDRWA